MVFGDWSRGKNRFEMDSSNWKVTKKVSLPNSNNDLVFFDESNGFSVSPSFFFVESEDLGRDLRPTGPYTVDPGRIPWTLADSVFFQVQFIE